ncbi:glycosyltransferase family 4 protein [Ornithinimicrobium pratense]|nr:glycosyltransferase family 4 protein [Ornithinimicrobium pratense]
MDHAGVVGALKLAHGLLQSIGWARFVARLNPDRVYVMSTVCPAPMLGTRLAGRPLVVFLSESVSSNPTLRSVVPKWVIIALVKRWADVTVAVSTYAASQWRGATIIEPPEVMDPDKALPDVVHGERPATPLEMVMLGTMSAEKGQLDAVRAVGLAVDGGVPLQLTFYGDADRVGLRALEQLISQLHLDEVVRHRGSTTTPMTVLAQADLSVVCSRNEAYGRITAESLLAGTPVVGYALGGTVEILSHGGGVLVPPAPAHLATAMATIATDPGKYVELRAAALRRREAREDFGDAARTLRRAEAELAALPKRGVRVVDRRD